MHLKWLEDFIAYAETRSFIRAAEQRNVTHPAFGRRIKSLESWVGVPLIDRGSFPSALTSEGERFLEVSRLVAGELDDVRAELRQRRSRDGRVATFATGRTLARTLFPVLHAELERSHRGVQVRLLTTTVHDGLVMLADGVADLLMCYAGPDATVDVDFKDYEVARIASEALVAVTSPLSAERVKAGLAGGRSRTPYLAYDPIMALGRVMRDALDRAKLSRQVEIVFESDMAEAIHDAARQGRGLAWLPQRLVADDLTGGRLVRVETPVGDLPLEIKLYRKRRNRRSVVQDVWSSILRTGATDFISGL